MGYKTTSTIRDDSGADVARVDANGRITDVHGREIGYRDMNGRYRYSSSASLGYDNPADIVDRADRDQPLSRKYPNSTFDPG